MRTALDSQIAVGRLARQLADRAALGFFRRRLLDLFLRGTDIFKALALGATAVGIGRPQVWGLAAFGQPGVEAVIDILNRELTTMMRQAGTASIANITGAQVLRSA